MNLFQFMSFFAASATFIIGIFAFLSHPSRKINQAFLSLAVVITLWQFSFFMGMGSTEKIPLIFWIKQASALSAFIPALMNQIRLAIVFQKESCVFLLSKNRLWLGLSVLVFAMCQTPWFLIDAHPPTGEQVLPIQDYGLGFLVFGLYFLLSFGTLFYLLFDSNRKLRGSEKAEIEYLLLSCGTGLFVGVFFLIAPQLTGWTDLGAFLPLSVILFSAITGYGIATRGIMDVPVLARRIIAYTMVIVYLSILYLVVFWFLDHLFLWTGQNPDPLAHLLTALVLVFSVSPAQGMAQNLTNRLFVHMPLLDVGRILRDAGRTLNTILTVEELCSKFQRILEQNLNTADLKIFALENEHYVQIFPQTTSRSMPATALLPLYLSENHELCVRELMQRKKITEETRLLTKELENEKVAGAICFHRNKKMTGFMLLGNRSSGRIYSHEETMVIGGLRDLFAVSYENAQLYTELQNGRIYMDLLLKNLVNGVLATDASGIISTCNQEASRILGCTEGELRGKNIQRLPQELFLFQKNILEKDLIIRDKEIILNAAEDHPVYLNAGASLFRDLKGNVMGSLLVLQDRTAIRNLEEQIKRSERLASLGTLSAGMAHEIKNPLVTLKTFTQLLPERYQDEDYRETFVTLASKEIDRIDGLMNKLLTLARPVKLELKEIALNRLLQKYVKLFREQAREVHIEVTEDFNADPDILLGEEDPLHQVLLNLLLNAQQAMPNGGEIQLCTRNIPGYVELQIKDSGEGISPEVQNHIFDPFFTTKSAGTGLGLAVAHQILEEHNAIVKIESAPGEGTTFMIRFPIPSPEKTI
ncbi:ATP-binding protein [Kiritimatiellaeota bacterium B1221]|nr:ATP-binding protein [Kiritimatiellaeota bacterium B1221]